MRWSVRIPLAVMLGLSLAVPSTLPAQAASTRNLFYGDGYGSYSFVGQNVMTGRTAYSVMGCQTPAGTHIANTMGDGEGEDPSGQNGNSSTGSVKTSADAIKTNSVTKSLLKATTNDVSMFKGRITASRVKSVSATFSDANGMHISPAGTMLADLVVDDQVFQVSPGPNTTVTLDGLGYVVMNEQMGSSQGALPSLVVNGIHVYVNQPNGLGIPVGSQYIVSHAFSALKTNVAGTVTGQAWGHKLFEGGKAQSGPSAIVYLPCVGTGGKVVENNVASVGQPGVFQAGQVRDTAVGTVGSKKATSETTSSVEGVNLLAGLITADLVKADARATKVGKTVTLSDAGSKFVNLVVAGKLIGSETGPNKAIPIPGVGILWLHQISRNGRSIQIHMLNLEVTQENPFGLKPGSKLQFAVAQAAILP
jgi:hypothetical protein